MTSVCIIAVTTIGHITSEVCLAGFQSLNDKKVRDFKW